MKAIHITIALASATLVLTVAANSQPVQLSPQPASSQQAAPSEVGKVYVPDLGDFMTAAQRNHEKLWLAGQARNWPLAEYNLAELKETLSSVEDFVPKYQGIPVGDMIDSLVTGPLAELEQAVAAKDFAKFSSSFDALTQACNSCHQAARHEFIVIQRPAQSSFPNQDFRPRQQ